jgi:hypothetical protein
LARFVAVLASTGYSSLRYFGFGAEQMLEGGKVWGQGWNVWEGHKLRTFWGVASRSSGRALDKMWWPTVAWPTHWAGGRPKDIERWGLGKNHKNTVPTLL